MEQELITLNSGKINDYIHHIDLKAYGQPRRLSVYIAEFDDCSILFDCGSSLDINNLIKYIKKSQIPLDSFKYLIPSHFHFDHAGGMHVLYNFLKKYNSNIKILTNRKTMELLNDYEHHFNRAKRTYGNFVGDMKSIDEKAFKIIQSGKIFTNNSNKIDIVDIFNLNEEQIHLSLLNTPGHVPGHQVSVLLKDNEIDFIYLGEAAGTIYNSTDLLTMPVSMPIYYNHDDYMNSVKELQKLNPKKAGFGHFGVVNGQNNFKKIIFEHESFMNEFKSLITKFYEEKPETRYIFKKIMPFLAKRTDLDFVEHSIFSGIALGIVYGMMISLGFRSIPEEDVPFFKKYSK